MGIVTRLIGRPARDRAYAQPRLADVPATRLPPRPAAARPGAPAAGAQPALRDVFTPTRPQRSSRRVIGRQPEMLRIFRALALDRAHVVLYGERGRGKTSVVNMVAGAARSAGYMVGRYACSAESEFDEIMRGIARDLPHSLLATPVSEDNFDGCVAALPAGRLTPRDIAALPSRLTGRHLVLIVDEFDRVEDDATRTRFADTIKQVSDRGVALSFIIVGVSDSLEELLGRHPSIQRNILGLALPLLNDAQVEEILVRGGEEVGVTFPTAARRTIVDLARGVPYVAQLLGLHAGDEAVSRGSTEVGSVEMRAACQRALDEMDPRLAVLYKRLVGRGRDGAMREVLHAIASGEQDRFARFIVQVAGGAVIAAGRRLDPAQWRLLVESGAVRECPSAGAEMYTFADAMLPHYILLRHAL